MGNKKAPDLLLHVILFFIVSRIVLEAIGILAVFYFPAAQTTDLQYHARQPVSLDVWARWDSEWYVLIAEKGYQSYEYFQEYGKGRYLPQDTSKFFPLYPSGIRLLNVVTGNSVVSGVLLSNLAALVFLYYFFLLTSKLMDPESALNASLYYLYFPTAFFLSAVYSESLFLAALAACFYYLEEKKLGRAAVACVLLMLARPQGGLALIPILWLAGARMPEKRLVAVGTLLTVSIIPLALYAIYIHTLFGSAGWIAESQGYWRGEIRYPLYALVRFAGEQAAIHGQHNSIIDFTIACLQLTALAVSFRRIPGPYYLYSMIVVVFPLSSSLFSFSRLCLVNLPFFMFLGHQVTGRWKVLLQLTFAMFLAFFMAAFACRYWVG